MLGWFGRGSKRKPLGDRMFFLVQLPFLIHSHLGFQKGFLRVFSLMIFLRHWAYHSSSQGWQKWLLSRNIPCCPLLCDLLRVAWTTRDFCRPCEKTPIFEDEWFVAAHRPDSRRWMVLHWTYRGRWWAGHEDHSPKTGKWKILKTWKTTEKIWFGPFHRRAALKLQKWDGCKVL